MKLYSGKIPIGTKTAPGFDITGRRQPLSAKLTSLEMYLPYALLVVIIITFTYGMLFLQWNLIMALVGAPIIGCLLFMLMMVVSYPLALLARIVDTKQ